MKGIATHFLAVTAAGVLFFGDAAQAQRDDSLQVGARYRITLPEFADRPWPQFPPSRWLAGALVEQRRDTLVVQNDIIVRCTADPYSCLGQRKDPLALIGIGDRQLAEQYRACISCTMV